MDKKGVEITLNFIVIAAIVLIALIVAVLFFTGATDKLFSKTREVSELSTQESSLAQSICESYCSQKNRAAYENPAFSQDIRDAGFKDCKDLLNKDFEQCLKSCKPISGKVAPECLTYLTEEECKANENCVWK